MNRILFVTAIAAVLSACQCGGAVTVPCSSDTECNGGSCVGGTCVGGSGGGGGSSSPGGGSGVGGGSGTGGGAAGTGGGNTMTTGCDPMNTANGTRDTDCDGLSDAEEYNTSYNGKKSDPCNSDTDGDGIRDGVELGKTSSVSSMCAGKFVPDADALTKTDPTLPDTDGDGLKDGEEDKNRDGKVDQGESNPNKKDTDCDGISDGDEVKGTLGCMSDPSKFDTDGDGLPDGVEFGLQMPGADALSCKYPATVFDTEPATKTNACNPDIDGDGISDGAEDVNKNGKVDMGELDPNNKTDGTGPAQEACSTANLKPITYQVSAQSDVQIALVPSFSEAAALIEGGSNRGYAFFDPTSKVAGLAISKMPAGGTASTEETFGRGRLAALGTVSGALTQTFTTWDGFAQSVRATYDVAGNQDLKAALDNLVKGYLGGTVTGSLPGSAGVNGPFKVQAEFVHRTNGRAIVVIALVPAAAYTGANVFQLDDTAGGSALAQFGDYTAPTCEVFAAEINAKVDFIWIVDDSGSMASSQAAVGNAGMAFGTKLAAAGLDWRVGGVSTGYWSDTTRFRPFTNQIATMNTWFTQGATPPWFGTSGSSSERVYQSFFNYGSVITPRGTDPMANKVRDGASLHLIALSDTDDQGGANGPAIATAIANLNGFAGGKATLHGIVCLEGQSCGDSAVPATGGRTADGIRATGGVLGDIQLAKSNSPQLAVTIDAILAAAIGGTGHQLLKPPLSATIKVAIEAGGTKGTCNANDIPRDRTNGFDFDSASRRIVFYGNCIPSAAGKKVAVSYRYWNDASPDPGGDPCGGACTGGKVCEPTSKSCVCPTNCGGTCQSPLVCDMATCGCVPGGIN